jgi:hypothetical protein
MVESLKWHWSKKKITKYKAEKNKLYLGFKIDGDDEWLRAWNDIDPKKITKYKAEKNKLYLGFKIDGDDKGDLRVLTHLKM